MEFKDKFREAYRVVLHAARDNNRQGTIDGFTNLCKLMDNQYNANNGDSIVVKAQLKYFCDVFKAYLQIVEKNGLLDNRVQKFFGLIDDDTAPSFEDFMKGQAEVPNIPSVDNNSEPEIHLEGLEPIKQKPKKTEDKPKKPIEYVKPIEPIDVIEPITEEDECSYDPTSLRTFIGQQHIVKPLLKEIAIAKQNGIHHLDNIMLLGNPGLGKTTLMKLIADELGVRYELMDCSQFRNSQQSKVELQNFLMKVARENTPVVIAFDEIHMLTDELQSSLLTLLNNRVYVSNPDKNGNIKRIPIEEFTFIAATTDDDKVINTVKDRCLRLRFQMKDYSHDELVRIYKNKVRSLGLTITDEAIESAIPRSRGSIRYVNAFIKGFDSELHNDLGIRVSTNIDLDVVLRFFKNKGIDEIGLEEKDIEILKAIEEIPSNTIGAETLSAKVGLDSKKYMSEYEPYLIKIGFITVSGKGRSLTEKAFNYLKKLEHV